MQDNTKVNTNGTPHESINPTKQIINDIKEALEAMIEPGQVVELRCLGVDGNEKRTDSGFFDDPKALATAAAGYDGRAQIYFTPNPVHPDLLARANNNVKKWVGAGSTTNDLQIVKRHWLFIDADPKRLSGISSTDAEHEAAISRIEAVRGYLTGRGWPLPIEADSGNGGHIDYRIDLPNTPESTELIKRCLQALSMQFSDDRVEIDTGNFNAARIWKLYGAKTIKGDDTNERPHRRSSILDKPERLEVVTVEQLQALANLIPEPEAKTPGKPSTGGTFNLEDWMNKHGVTGKKAPWNGGQRWRLDACPFSTAHSDGAFIVQLANGAIGAGCKHNSCQGKTWHDLRAIYDGDKATRSKAEKPKQQEKTLFSALAYRINFNDRIALDDGTAVFYKDGDSDPRPTRITKLVGPKDGVIFYEIEGIDKSVSEEEILVEAPDGDPLVRSVRNLGYTFRLNRLEDLIEVNGKRLDDITMSKIYLAMRSRFSKTPKTYIDDCINVLADENAYHPIRDYLNGLQWDGKNHLGEFLGHLTGDGRTVAYSNGEMPLYAALLTRWLLGCVARGLDGDKPAAFKHQTPMLVLIGPQGIGKSSIIRWLCTGVGLDYHRESMLDPHHPDHIRSAVTKWIWEVSELGASLRRGDRDALKGFITQEWHTYRKPWGKANITKPLLSNFVGTINPEVGFLDDPTGHRRFLPVDIKAINHGYKDAVDVNQLWAQVVHLYKNGESPELAPTESEALKESYRQNEVENPLQTYLQMYFDIRPGDNSRRTFTADIIDRLKAFGVSLHTDNRVAGTLINAAMAPLGVERIKFKVDGVSGWGWLGVSPNTKRPPTQFR